MGLCRQQAFFGGDFRRSLSKARFHTEVRPAINPAKRDTRNKMASSPEVAGANVSLPFAETDGASSMPQPDLQHLGQPESRKKTDTGATAIRLGILHIRQ